MMALIPGDMRHTINVVEVTSTRDEYGAEVLTESTLYTLRASVKYGVGNKGIDLNEIFSHQSIQFSTYYRSFDPTHIIEFKDRRYRIISITEIGYREGLIINTELINE